MIKYADCVLETSTTQGVGPINLDGPTVGFQSFMSGVGDGAIVTYLIRDDINWEVGRGIITGGNPDQLSRDEVFDSSNGKAIVNWGPGRRNVYIGASAHAIAWLDENGNLVNAYGISSGTGNAHIVTLSKTPRALSDGMKIVWRAPAANTGAITVNVNGLGAIPYRNYNNAAFTSGMAPSGSVQEAIYSADLNAFLATSQVFLASAFATAAQGALAATAVQRNEEVITANSGSAYALNYANSQNFAITLTANCTFTITNPPAKGGCINIRLGKNAAGRTATWPASVKWPDGSAPTLTNANASIDVITLVTFDGGTTWQGSMAMADSK